jgi:hypothetical protein
MVPMQVVEEKIRSSGGNFAIQMAPKVVTATDEDELAARIKRAEEENQEVDGDDDDEEQVKAYARSLRQKECFLLWFNKRWDRFPPGRIRIRNFEGRTRGSGSVPKYFGFGTLVVRVMLFYFESRSSH